MFNLFVGSTVEGLEYARTLQDSLKHDLAVSLWTEIFKPGLNNLEALLNATKQYDCAVFFFTCDDTVTCRGVEKNAVRDNLLFEYGLFIGALGRERVWFAYDLNEDIKNLPTDICGINPITFNSNSTPNESIVGPVATAIKKAMKNFGKESFEFQFRVRVSIILQEIRNLICKRFYISENDASATLCFSFDEELKDWDVVYSNRKPMNMEDFINTKTNMKELANSIMLGTGKNLETEEYLKNNTFGEYLLASNFNTEKLHYLHDVFEDGVKEKPIGIYRRTKNDFDRYNEVGKWGSCAGYIFFIDDQDSHNHSILGVLFISSFGKPFDNNFLDSSKEKTKEYILEEIIGLYKKLIEQELKNLFRLRNQR
jgi:hypothetical protein